MMNLSDWIFNPSFYIPLIINIIIGIIGYLWYRRTTKQLDENKEEHKKTQELIKIFAEKYGIYYIDGLPEAKSKIRNLYLKGLESLDHYDFIEAIKFFKKALDNSKDIEERGAIHIALGFVYEKKGNINKAEYNYKKALIISEKYKIKILETIAYNGLGIINKIRNVLNISLEYHKKGLEIAEKINSKEATATHLGNIGIIYFIKNDLENAYKYFKKADIIFSEIDNSYGRLTTQSNIANIYFRNGNLKKALQIHKKVLEQSISINDLLGMINEHKIIGLIYIEMKKPELALLHLKIAKRIGSDINVKGELNNIEEHIYKAKKIIN